MSITEFVGAFPTDFTLPDDCDDLSSNSVVGFDFAATCLPENFNADPTAYYSPGTACPDGYTAQDTCTRSSGDTSTVTCCPVRDDLTMWCVDDPETLSDAWESLFCTWSAGGQETVLLVTIDESSTPAVTMTGNDGINAYGLRMVYEPSDLETSATAEPTSTKPTQTTQPSETGRPRKGATGTDSADPASSDDGGLSTGAKAAIGVVIPVFIIALAVGMFFLYRKRKQSYEATAELPAEEKPGGATPALSELYGSGGTSFQGGMTRPEMPGSTFVSELEGSSAHGGSASPSFSHVPANTPSPVTGGYTTPHS